MIFLMVFLIWNSCQHHIAKSQTFFATYDCKMNARQWKSSDTITENNIAKLLAPSLNIEYTVYGNNNYVEVFSRLMSVEGESNLTLKRTGPSKLIFDIKRNLVYSE